MKLPEAIEQITGNAPFTENEVGMSGSRVLMYPNHVLKIQQPTAETANEAAAVAWLRGRLPVPEIPVYLEEGNTAYTLMSRMRGKMLCDEEFLNNPGLLLDRAAEALHMLWEIPVENCPLTASRLTERLKAARYNVEHGLVDTDNVEPETFGPNGFNSPMALLEWLEQNRPEEELVFTHGDFCLPNIFADENGITGLIDLGKMGPADRWQDAAIALRTLHHNFYGHYHDGHMFYRFEPQELLDRLGIPMDEERNRYYLLLDELF